MMGMQTETHFSVAQTQWGPRLDEAQRERNLLLIAVASKAMARGLTLKTFEEETGVDMLHLGVLLTGRPCFAPLLDDAIPALAKFLGWPAIAVKAMSGHVLLSDFYTEAELIEQPSLMASLLEAPTLKEVPETVAVFAGVLACLDTRKRKAIRDVCADGPPERY